MSPHPIAPLGDCREDGAMPERRTTTRATAPTAPPPEAGGDDVDQDDGYQPAIVRATSLAMRATGITIPEMIHHWGIARPSFIRYFNGVAGLRYFRHLDHALSGFEATLTMTIDQQERLIPVEPPSPELLRDAELSVINSFAAFSNTPVKAENYTKLRQRFTLDPGPRGVVTVNSIDEAIGQAMQARDIKPYLLCLQAGVPARWATAVAQGQGPRISQEFYQIWKALRIAVTVRIGSTAYVCGQAGPLPTRAKDLVPVTPPPLAVAAHRRQRSSKKA